MLDRGAPVTLYYQVASILHQQLRQGEYKPNDYFATEQELQEEFQVSRATIRKALERLEADGLIYRVTGKGIFVSPPKLRVVLPELLSFSEEMKKRGMNPSTRMLEVEVTEVSDSIAEVFGALPGTKMLLVRRVRLGDMQPIVYSESYLPLQLGLNENDDFMGSLYDLIFEKSGRHVEAARHTIGGAVLTGEAATLLEVDDGFPGLRFNRVGYDSDGFPIVYETGLARADKYAYEIHLKRSLSSL